MATTKDYSRVRDGVSIVNELCEKYPDTFWAVIPSSVTVMGIDNVERTEKAVEKSPIWSKMRTVKGVERAIFQENNVSERHIIEVYWSDWNAWDSATKAAVIANHLLEITPDMEKTNRPDCIGFMILMDVLGVDWSKKPDGGIPNLLAEDVEFNLKLRPGIDEAEADMANNDEIVPE